jgi:hypothetical protein
MNVNERWIQLGNATRINVNNDRRPKSDGINQSVTLLMQNRDRRRADRMVDDEKERSHGLH